MAFACWQMAMVCRALTAFESSAAAAKRGLGMEEASRTDRQQHARRTERRCMVLAEEGIVPLRMGLYWLW